MCLAEALLRVPDAATADALIRDKIGDIDWAEHMGESSSTFVNAATFSLMLTGEVLERPEEAQKGMGKTLKRAVNRLGEPVIRTATLQAMRILGGQFVYGRTINESLEARGPERARGLTHSFDMLGEAAMTFADAERYRVNYHEAIERLVREATGGVATSPGISVKLSALHPKYTFLHADLAIADLLPIVRDLATAARDANIHFTIDAEEADRLELSLDLIEALARDDSLFTRADGSRWEGFGLAIQAYQKRGVPMCEWTARLARKYDRKFFVRLVKGAYWDTEIKLSHVGGYKDFPVFTRKLATDVSYLACAEKMLAADDVIYPAFATHNAYTIGCDQGDGGRQARSNSSACTAWARTSTARSRRWRATTAPMCASMPPPARTRTCSPIWSGACSKTARIPAFVNRMADAEVPASDLATDPVADMAQLDPYRNPTIPLPEDIFPGRKNSAGIDLADPLVLEPLQERLAAAREPALDTQSRPSCRAPRPKSPRSTSRTTCRPKSARAATRSISKSRKRSPAPKRSSRAGIGWAARNARCCSKRRPICSRNIPTNSSACASARRARRCSTRCSNCAKRSISCASTPEARRQFTGPIPLPGPTGEENRLSLHGAACSPASARGISRWRSSSGHPPPRSPRAIRSSPSPPSRRR